MGILLELNDDAATLLIKAQAEEIEQLRTKRRRPPVSRSLQSISMKAYWAKRKMKEAAVTASSNEPAFKNGSGHIENWIL